ncbi:hypothetical protein ABTQ33_10060 [Paucilactobacillus suebicus]|uniref:hypothetical protein n=1 Tax=Paucilactobacillus suebicus TaxID=152335 RepID=UPI0002490BD9|nr:hypothetical protein [Paucilactobacillus suebicus]
MHKIKLYVVLLTALLVLILVNLNANAQATTNSGNKIMLVYDSKNTADHDEKKIDTLQRILTSMNFRVRTLKESNYHGGMLNSSYTAVITMVNWDEAGFTNHQFESDRDNFTGYKIHIGAGLTNNEATQMNVTTARVHQQQFILDDGDNQQILPFSESITVIKKAPSGAQPIGELKTQQQNQKNYSFSTIVGKNAYIPEIANNGLELMVAESTLSQLFGDNSQYKPLLTFTNVSPYVNLKLLVKTSKYCSDHNIPFAISTVTVDKNTELQAYKRFTTALRKVENYGGVIFVQAPTIGGATKDDGPELSQMFTKYFVSFANNQVFPVGISAQNFWNQDTVLRNNSLAKADHWLLLPNTDVTYLKQDNNSRTAVQSLFALPASSINSMKNTSKIKFNVPTALTISIPESNSQLQTDKKEIDSLQTDWLSPKNERWQTRIHSGSTTVEYRSGKYYLNKEYEKIKNKTSTFHVKDNGQTSNTIFKRFFKIQGLILAVFFILVSLILTVFILIGRRIYRNMFKR